MKSWRSLITWRRPTPRTPAEMNHDPRQGRPFLNAGVGRPLRLRLLFWIILALLPAAILALIQGWDRVSRDVADVRDLLIQTAKATAGDAETLLASEEQILRALSNLPEVREGGAGLQPGARQCAQGPVLFHEYRPRERGRRNPLRRGAAGGDHRRLDAPLVAQRRPADGIFRDAADLQQHRQAERAGRRAAAAEQHAQVRRRHGGDARRRAGSTA